MSVDLRLSDSREVLADMDAESIDAIVCDPPYEYGFMGKAWDSTGIAADPEFWALCLRVLKPGGHLIAFSSTRTSHRMVGAIEDAGFDIRDTLSWCYWSGFPKSLDISKSIDGLHGAEREVIGKHPNPGSTNKRTAMGDGWQDSPDITAPETEDAKRWTGYGTAVKPAIEPCVLARKPLAESSIARQVLATGTGALNLDACRFAPGDPMWPGPDDGETPTQHGGRSNGEGTEHGGIYGAYGATEAGQSAGQLLGRFPANLIHCPKASRAEREAGCEALATDCDIRNGHPTVKPIRLMRWLCRLVGGMPGSVILDPFLGSGTTGIAAMAEGFDFIGIEREAEYMQIAAARIRHYATKPVSVPDEIDVPAAVQASLFGGG